MSRFTRLRQKRAAQNNCEDDTDEETNSDNPESDDDEKVTSDDEDGDDAFGMSELTVYDLSDVSTEDVLDELTRILPNMTKKVRVKDAAYVEEAVEKFRNLGEGEGDNLGEHLVSLDFVEIFQRHWKENFAKITDAENFDIKEWNTAKSLLRAMRNISEKCSSVCEKILAVDLHSDFLDFMDSECLSPARMNEDRPSFIVHSFVGILQNVVEEDDDAWEELRDNNAVERFQPFRECGNFMISCICLMIQSHLMTEDENEKLNSSDDVFQLLVTLLDAAIKKQTYLGMNFDVIEVLGALNNLAANDNNKRRIIDSGALPYYVYLMSSTRTSEEQHEAAYGLWSLAFSCKEEIRQQKGCIEGLNALLKSEDEEVRKQAEGALWILERKDEPEPESEDQEDEDDDDDGHVFISYQWDYKETVVKIAEQLKTAGFRIWIDVDNMSGSVMDAMAEAVEKAAVVVVCLAQKYKLSTNCRAEIEYAFRLKKKIMPIRLQSKYDPDGWLGLIAGSKLVYDFSDTDKFQESMKNLIKEIEKDGKTK